MNSTQRVLAAIDFKTPDRIPVWDNFIGRFPQMWRSYMGFGESVDPADYYGIDVSIVLGDEGFFPSLASPRHVESGYEIWTDSWGREVRAPVDNPICTGYTSYALKSKTDLDQLEFESATSASRYSGIPGAIARAKEAERCLFTKVGGIYIRSHHLWPEEQMLMDMAMDEGFCDDLFDRVCRHLTDVALHTLSITKTYETGLFVYDDMANTKSPMFSPAMFERYFLPRYHRMICELRNAGCKHVFLHSDGNIGPLIDLLLEAGFEGFNPLEPRCGLRLPELRRKYGKRFVMFGGVCNTQILPRGDRNEIESHVRESVEIGREGGVVLGQASVAEDISPESYDFYMSLVRKYGSY